MDTDGDRRPEEISMLSDVVLCGDEGVDAVLGSRFTGNVVLGVVLRLR